MKMNTWGRMKHRLYTLEGGKNANKLNGTVKVCAEREAAIVMEITSIKEIPDLHWNKENGTLRARSNPTNLTCEKRDKDSLLLENNCH